MESTQSYVILLVNTKTENEGLQLCIYSWVHNVRVCAHLVAWDIITSTPWYVWLHITHQCLYRAHVRNPYNEAFTTIMGFLHIMGYVHMKCTQTHATDIDYLLLKTGETTSRWLSSTYS